MKKIPDYFITDVRSLRKTLESDGIEQKTLGLKLERLTEVLEDESNNLDVHLFVIETVIIPFYPVILANDR